MRDHKIIQGHGKSQQKSGENAGHYIRKNNFKKGIDRRGSQIQRSFICAFACLLQLWHYTQNHIWNIKGNVGQKNGRKAKGKAECNKQKHQ